MWACTIGYVVMQNTVGVSCISKMMQSDNLQRQRAYVLVRREVSGATG